MISLIKKILKTNKTKYYSNLYNVHTSADRSYFIVQRKFCRM